MREKSIFPVNTITNQRIFSQPKYNVEILQKRSCTIKSCDNKDTHAMRNYKQQHELYRQQNFSSQLELLLTDNLKHLTIRPEWQCNHDPNNIERCLSHRDEAIQYGAALSLMNLDAEDCLRIINSMEERLWSDYVTHYYLTCIIGLRGFSEKSYLVRSALSETTPQYTKSRVAAAWACLKLELYDQLDLLYQLSNSAYWKPLRWSCQQVFARMIDQQQSQKER